MKGDHQDTLDLAPQNQRTILDEIRNDNELVERLRITPQELQALSKCALLGTLTCKQDMLFILRQIREAGDPGHATRVPQPAPPQDPKEAPLPDFRRLAARSAPSIAPEPGSLAGIVRRRLPEQLGILFWSVVLVAGFVWNGVIAMARWRDNFMTTIGVPAAAQAPHSDAWYSHLDQANVLLWGELLFVGCVAVAMYLKARNSTRHLKVRPGRRLL